jgi:hypothetical protein
MLTQMLEVPAKKYSKMAYGPRDTAGLVLPVTFKISSLGATSQASYLKDSNQYNPTGTTRRGTHDTVPAARYHVASDVSVVPLRVVPAQPVHGVPEWYSVLPPWCNRQGSVPSPGTDTRVCALVLRSAYAALRPSAKRAYRTRVPHVPTGHK